MANTNLNVLTAVFYWFTLTCDEPKISAKQLKNHEGGIHFALMLWAADAWRYENVPENWLNVDE